MRNRFLRHQGKRGLGEMDTMRRAEEKNPDSYDEDLGGRNPILPKI